MHRLDLKSPQELLRLGYSVIPLAAGADKFTNLLTDWEQYLAPNVARRLGVKPRSMMKLVGVVEVAVGALMLTRFRKQAAYIASAWLAAIAGELIVQGRYLDVAARDALLSLSAFAFARLEAPIGREARAPRRLTRSQAGTLPSGAPTHVVRQPSLVH